MDNKCKSDVLLEQHFIILAKYMYSINIVLRTVFSDILMSSHISLNKQTVQDVNLIDMIAILLLHTRFIPERASTYLPTFVRTYLSNCLSIYHSILPSIYPSIHLSSYLSIHFMVTYHTAAWDVSHAGLQMEMKKKNSCRLRVKQRTAMA